MPSEQEPFHWPNGTYPIREFARLSGVNPATLRAWERRYGIVKPLRTPKGHRFYTDDHLQDVRRILYWLEQGYPVRQVQLLLNQPISQETTPDPGNVWGEQQQRLVSTVEQFELGSLEHTLNDGLAHYPLAVYFEHAVLPALQQIRGHAHGRLLASLLEQRLNQRLQMLMHQQQRHAAGPRLLLASNSHSGHTELLVRACAIGSAGLQVEVLDTSLSAADVRLAANVLAIDHLWIYWQPATDSSRQEWQALQQLQRPLWVSGCPSFECHGPNSHDVRTQPLQRQIQNYIFDGGHTAHDRHAGSQPREVSDHD